MCWGIPLLALRWLNGRFVTESDSLAHILLFYVVAGVANYYWFLSALLICLLLGSLISWLQCKSTKYGIIVLFCSLPIFSILRVDIFHFTFIWFYYGCGMLFKQYEAKCKTLMSNRTYWIIIIASIFCVVIGYFFYPKYTFYRTSNLISKTCFSFILLRYLLCLVASVCVLHWIFQIYDKYKNKSIIIYLTQTGSETLFLYCSHVLILSYLVTPMIDNYFGDGGVLSDMTMIRYYIVAPIITLLLYYFLCLLAMYLKRIPIFRVLFLGLPIK